MQGDDPGDGPAAGGKRHRDEVAIEGMGASSIAFILPHFKLGSVEAHGTPSPPQPPEGKVRQPFLY